MARLTISALTIAAAKQPSTAYLAPATARSPARAVPGGAEQRKNASFLLALRAQDQGAADHDVPAGAVEADQRPVIEPGPVRPVARDLTDQPPEPSGETTRILATRGRHR